MQLKTRVTTGFLRAIRIGALAALPLLAHCQGWLDKSSWQLDRTTSEDFNPGTTPAILAPRWDLQLPGGAEVSESNSKMYFEPYVTRDNIYVANGCVYLNTYKYAAPIYHANDRNYHYATSFLRTRHDDFPTISPPNDTTKGGMLYGMFEVRCKLPSGSGQYPSFWLAGNNAWPPEVDVFEFNGNHPTTFFSTAHWPNPAFAEGLAISRDSSRGKTFRYARKKYLTKKFHTWTLVWTPTELAWFLDGKNIYVDTVKAHIPGAATPTANPYEVCKYRKMDVILNSILNYPDSTVTAFEPLVIDYVRVYRPVGFVPYVPGQPLEEYYGRLQALYRKTPYQAKRRARP